MPLSLTRQTKSVCFHLHKNKITFYIGDICRTYPYDHLDESCIEKYEKIFLEEVYSLNNIHFDYNPLESSIPQDFDKNVCKTDEKLNLNSPIKTERNRFYNKNKAENLFENSKQTPNKNAFANESESISEILLQFNKNRMDKCREIEKELFSIHNTNKFTGNIFDEGPIQNHPRVADMYEDCFYNESEIEKQIFEEPQNILSADENVDNNETNVANVANLDKPASSIDISDILNIKYDKSSLFDTNEKNDANEKGG